MHTARTVSLAELLPTDLVDGIGELKLTIPTWAFEPDAWSFAFLRGLLKLQLDGLHVWEIGCGTGLNVIILRRYFRKMVIRFSDYNPLCAALTMSNLAQTGDVTATEPLYGQWDLIHNSASRMLPGHVKVIVACIPQVPANGFDLSSGDNYAHYYDPKQYSEARLNAVGLGLNEALLVRAPQVLHPGDRVVLNVGGRPGLERLLLMFCERGYTPRIIHQEMIPQHTETSVATLAELERSGQPDFEFYADQAGTQPINAREAEIRRLAGAPLFHRIYVIEGTLMPR